MAEGYLSTVTVTGNFSGDFGDWGDIANPPAPSNIRHIYAVAYLSSNDALIDFNSEIAVAREDAMKIMMLQGSDMYDLQYELNGGDAADAMTVAAVRVVGYRPPAAPLFGGIWSTIKATAHWLWGNGSALSIDINRLRLNIDINEVAPGSPNHLPGFIAQNTQPGTYQYVSGPYGYSTYDDNFATATLLGGIVLNTTGTLERFADGSYSFNGVTLALTDRFNMDKRPGRPWWADRVVDVAQAAGGNDFDIQITGQYITNFTGR